ncbi:MAG: hypothetical protein HUU26_07785 [Gemmatimonadaceae bacterium]|nr:hypothetical protein [Gemmatimonadaceae bacterium]
MTEERLNELLDDARRTWPEPAEQNYDAMWARVERESFSLDRRRGGVPSWRLFGAGVAAALALGVGLGRFTSPSPGTPAVAAADTEVPAPRGVYDRVASELLGRTALLLTALPAEAVSSASSERFAAQATELLTSTRLLLDSPAANDARFKDLLEDLELVLAQIAMLQTGRTRQEIDLITDALEERDVVPRIRSAVARLSADD